MTFFLALSALTALVLASEGSPVNHRDDGNFSAIIKTCEDHLEGCIPNRKKGSQTSDSQNDLVAFLGNRAALKMFAGATQNTAQCVDKELASPSCEGVQLGDTDFGVFRLAVAYLDISSHLDILVAASSDPCLVNEPAQQTALTSLVTCYDDHIMQLEQGNCEALLDSLRNCSVSAVSENCGDAAVAFVESVWEFAEDPEVHTMLLSTTWWSVLVDCHFQAALVKRFAKRAIEKMRK